MQGPSSDIRDVQERWLDAREEWDVYEKAQWRREAEIVRNEAVRMNKIRERKSTDPEDIRMG
jgi:hypothetical protein